MRDFMVGFAFCASIAACVLVWLVRRKMNRIFTIMSHRGTRTVTVDMSDGKVTIVKEYKNDVVDAK